MSVFAKTPKPRFRRSACALAIAAIFQPLPATTATVNWLTAGPGTFQWATATNWSSNPALPGAADDVVVNVGGLPTINGTLSLGTASTVSSFTQSSGTLAGAGNLTVTGATTLSGGQMIGTGQTITQGLLTISNSIGLDEGRVLRVEGAGTWSAGNISLNPNNTGNATAGILRIASGGSLNATGNNTITTSNFGAGDTGASALVDNQGTFTKSVPAPLQFKWPSTTAVRCRCRAAR